jgi:hypothetical protein
VRRNPTKVVGCDEADNPTRQPWLALQSRALAGSFQQADGRWHGFDVVVNYGEARPTSILVHAANEDLGDIAALLWQREPLNDTRGGRLS